MDDAAPSLDRARELESACDFAAAGEEALAAGDAGWAARLAALARHEELFGKAEAALATRGEDALAHAAADLSARGYDVHAGRLFSRGNRHLAAGEAFARGGDAKRAALELERAGKPAQGAQALERGISDDPRDESLRRALAELLARHGRTEAAIKIAQQMSPGEERDRTLPLLARSLAALGLSAAAEEVRREIDERGLDGPPASEGVAAPQAGERVLFGRYQVVREVAETPHAHLFEATDRVTGQHVAVKVLVAGAHGAGRDAATRFAREARALAALRHATIVSLLDFVPEGPALILEWMSGGSLADLLRRESFAPDRAREVIAAVLTALGEAHRLGVLHRDVKPSNILFDGVGAPKLSDFGAAHMGDQSTTVTAGAIGTLSYMSPEQRVGKPASAASDLYSVGVLLYEMLTGALPDESPSPVSDHNPELGPQHDALLSELLSQRPEDRPSSAFAARQRLMELHWPRLPAPAQARATRSSAPPAAALQRLVQARAPLDGRDRDRLAFDTTTDRHVLVVPLEGEWVSRIKAFAKIADLAVSAVLRASPHDASAWVEAPRGVCLADQGGSLSPPEVGTLRRSLAALHEVGGVHGALDLAHLYREQGELWLAFPRTLTEGASVVSDLRALELLAGH